jgi:hypothetical protein
VDALALPINIVVLPASPRATECEFLDDILMSGDSPFTVRAGTSVSQALLIRGPSF